jgi:hypothetical protein
MSDTDAGHGLHILAASLGLPVDDPTPTCDLCGEPWEEGEEGEDWNGETGCHRTCERDEEPARLGGDSPTYRADMSAAGRGHLLR